MRGPSHFARVLRRTIAIVIVVAFGLAAVGGIIVMLGDVESEATFQVIGTTAVTGVCSVAAFCGATLIGRRAQWFGSVTVLLAVLTLALSLLFLWGDPYGWTAPVPGSGGTIVGDVADQLLVSCILVTAVASVSALILLLVQRSWVMQVGLPITLGLLVLGTALVLITIWVEAAWEYDWLTRLNGIVWILAALGVVVVPLSSLLLKAGAKPAAVSAAATEPEPADPTLSPSTLDRLEAAARAEGITADELVDRLLTDDSPSAPGTASLPGDPATEQDTHPRH
ncbi:hypothetical protein [Brevibacterium oceani]|uniref:hypothetical protein n=1 Tax=Brevibacterium oceani TaxID=358099 RepID=UPI0015E7AD08|nr:hypothetical protein [Brevibacterium oceani]